MSKSLFLGLLLLGACAFTGCNSATGDSRPDDEHADQHHGPPTVKHAFAGSYPIRAVCTIGIDADLVRNVGGEHIAVTQLMGEGVDPHLYKTSPGDVSKMNSADVIFYSGLHLEGKMSDLLARMARKKETFPVTASIAEDRVLHNVAGTADPHVWFDAVLWSTAMLQVRDILVAFDPPHAAEYRAAAAAYEKELAELDDYARREISSIPEDRRVMVTAHDAFRYFGRTYGIEVRGIQGINTEGEASVKEINNLVELLVSRKIKAVFVESSVSERNIRALVEGCQARGHEITIGGELFSDAMGKDGTPEGTYVGMVKHNVDTIVRALK
jgi:manganese/zinc/iron transport system substrate-binding protein